MVWALGETAAPLNDSQMWVFIGLGVIGLIYLIVLRPMMRKKKDPLERPPAFASISQQRAVERQMQSLLVELSEMARQITAQIDTRASKLELLLKDADKKLAELKAASNGQQPTIIGMPPPAPSMAEVNEEPDPRHVEVYALADRGRDVGEIASELGRPRGEVELILALRTR